MKESSSSRIHAASGGSGQRWPQTRGILELIRISLVVMSARPRVTSWVTCIGGSRPAKVRNHLARKSQNPGGGLGITSARSVSWCSWRSSARRVADGRVGSSRWARMFAWGGILPRRVAMERGVCERRWVVEPVRGRRYDWRIQSSPAQRLAQGLWVGELRRSFHRVSGPIVGPRGRKKVSRED